MAATAGSVAEPFTIEVDRTRCTLVPAGQVIVRRLSDLAGLFADADAWQAAVTAEDRVVYTVTSSPVPEAPAELPQSITRIQPGRIGDEFFFTKGHLHEVSDAEIYLGLEGEGALLLYDGHNTRYLEMAPDRMGYIPPGWAHRSVNTGSGVYSFLAIYPGCAGHDYDWVPEHGFGARVFATGDRPELRRYDEPGVPLPWSTCRP